MTTKIIAAELEKINEITIDEETTKTSEYELDMLSIEVLCDVLREEEGTN
jgi:hypothetical protein